MMRKYLTEFIGTFFLVLTIGMAGNPLAIGCILVAMVYMGGHISGAHYNPAVSLAVWFRNKMDAMEFVKYIIAQLLGATLAALVVNLITGNTFAPAPAANYSTFQVLLAEFLFTFALASVVLNVATTKSSAGRGYYGLAIGFTVLAGAIAAGPVSGGAFNPAVAFGPILIDSIIGMGNMSNLWIYLAGCFAGGAVAGWIFNMMNPEE